MINRFKDTLTAPHGKLSSVGQSAARDAAARHNANVDTVSHSKDKENIAANNQPSFNGGIVKMDTQNKKQFYTEVRGGLGNGKISKSENYFSIKSNIENITPANAAGFEKIIQLLLDEDKRFGLMPVVLSFAAACYLKPHFLKSGIPLHILRIACKEWWQSANGYLGTLKGLFATESDLYALDATHTRIMYCASSSDFVPLILYGYDDYFTVPKSKRNEIVMAMRALYNGGRSCIGQPNLTFKDYEYTAPGVMITRTPPTDKGLRWRSIQVEITDEHGGHVSEPSKEQKAELATLGVALLQTAKCFKADFVKKIYKCHYEHLHRELRLGHFGAEQIADLSMGLWLLAATATRLGTTFIKAFGCDPDEVEARLIELVNLEGIE